MAKGPSPFGEMLFDADEQAIYLFRPEADGRPACYGDCAAAWPPVLTRGRPEALAGLRPGLLGQVPRRDGTTQVTYGGWPLYTYAHEGPREVLCHDVVLNGGLWLAVGPDRRALRPDRAGTARPPPASDPGHPGEAADMDRTMTVSIKGLLVTGVVLLALLVAYLLGGAGGAAPSPAQAAPAASERPAREDVRTLRMVGTGEATVVPDQLGFTLSVTAKQPALDDALGRSSATMRRVLAALDDQGVRDADVQTTGLQMYPEYDYPSYGPPVLTGYRVTQRARVVVRELARGGEAVSTAVETGGNAVRVTDIRLGRLRPGRRAGPGPRRGGRGGHRQGRAVRRRHGADPRRGARAAGGRGRHAAAAAGPVVPAGGSRRAGRAARQGGP